MASTDLDISNLAFERPARPARVRRDAVKILTRFVLPAAILCGFAALVAIAGGFAFVSPRLVSVVPVMVTRGEVQREGQPLFQAAGWVEPRPSLVNVASLAEGVVEQVLVVEGQEVRAGEPIARLIETDAGLTLRQAQAAKELRQAEMDSAQAELKAARLRFENPVHLRSLLAQAQSELARSQTELSKIPFLIESAEAKFQYAAENYDRKRIARDALPDRLIREAKSERDSAEALLEELRQRTPRLEAEVRALERQTEAVAEQLRLLIDESRQLEDAEARSAAAAAKLKDAEIAVEQAELQLSRSTIKAPISGRILQLVAHPGTRVMGLESAAGQSSSTVATMYDPHQLQVRTDVRLEDVPLVQTGQAVIIETASVSEPLRGSVLRATSSANIQKNTLEVKAAINDAPATISPEMLVTVTFLAPPTSANEGTDTSRQKILVPKQLVQSSGASSYVWIIDSRGHARQRAIKQGTGRQGTGRQGTGRQGTGRQGTGRQGTGRSEQMIEIVEGLAVTDKLIASDIEELVDGERLKVRGEDPAIGMDVREN